MSDIQTSDLTCAGVALTFGLSMCVHSMQFQTSLFPPVQFTSRSTPFGTYQRSSPPSARSIPATG